MYIDHRFFFLSLLCTVSVELQMYPALVVDKMLKALKLHSNEARLKFPRLLQIIEQYPEETLSLMTKEVVSFIYRTQRHAPIYIQTH